MTNTVIGIKKRDYYWAKDGLILLGILIVAFLLRVLPEQQTVFGSGWFNIQGVDSYYHLRLIENLVQHFPFRIAFDPYTFFPNGQAVYFAPFYDILIGFGAWVIGLGAPTQHIIEIVAAYTPPVLGILTLIPVYFIGKMLFSRKVGLLAALLAGILPGQFFAFSSLGKVDHHVAELLFSTTAAMFLLLALNKTKEKPVAYKDLLHKDWKLIKTPLIFSLLSGFALGLYLLTWVGGLLFVFLFFCFFLLMFIIEYLRHNNTDYLAIIAVPLFLVSLLMIIPFLDQLAYWQLEIVSLAAGALAVPVLSGISKLIGLNNLKRYWLPAGIVILGGLAVMGLYFLSPSIFNAMADRFATVFTPSTDILTVAEVQPFFLSNGKFTLTPLWNAFTTSGILGIIAFIIMVFATIRKMSSERVLLLIWFFLVFLATISQIRFNLYLTVLFAVLSAYLIWGIVDFIPRIWTWLNSGSKKSERRKAKQRSKHEIKPQGAVIKYAKISLSIIIIFFVGVYPNIKPVFSTAAANLGTDRYWHSAMTWMKENTPEPFSDADFYYKLYEKPPSGQNYSYPASAYGVLSWWSFGHFITEVAHRIPNANPNQSGAAAVAGYLLEQDIQKANEKIDRLGSEYVIIDLSMALPFNSISRRFPNIAVWAGTDVYQYADVYYVQKDSKWEPVFLYYPEYYYCMNTRLYNFDGKAQIPIDSSTVISYTVSSGYRLIQSSQTFSTYEEAEEFIQAHPGENYRLVGKSPLISPVPLEKLNNYEEVYQSDTISESNGDLHYLKIFKYSP